jgi:hypothetical protein
MMLWTAPTLRHRDAIGWLRQSKSHWGEPSSEVSTIGFDIAKSVFPVRGIDVLGAVVIRKRVSRSEVLEYFGELPLCLVGIEASA